MIVRKQLPPISAKEFPNISDAAEPHPVGLLPVQHSKKALATLQCSVDFSSGQLEAICPAIHGKDVFVRMATTAGKSLRMFAVPLAYSNDAV